LSAGPTIRLLLPCPDKKEGKAWGDYYFGHSLGDALERLGCQVLYSYRERGVLARVRSFLDRLVHWRELELVIRGKRTWRPVPGKRAAMWLISRSDSISIPELRRYFHVFVASRPYLRRIEGQIRSASLLLQCTDSTRFGPREVRGSQPCLFVGNRRKGFPRRVVDLAVDAGHEVEVWGRGWSDAIAAERLAGLHIENRDLADHYRAAQAVLNDHTPAMLEDGFVSNRLFDVAACATPLVTEDMEGIPIEFRPHLYLYKTLDEVSQALRSALDSGPSEEASRIALAQQVLREHTFDQRAMEILQTLTRPHQAPLASS